MSITLRAAISGTEGDQALAKIVIADLIDRHLGGGAYLDALEARVASALADDRDMFAREKLQSAITRMRELLP